MKKTTTRFATALAVLLLGATLAFADSTMDGTSVTVDSSTIAIQDTGTLGDDTLTYSTPYRTMTCTSKYGTTYGTATWYGGGWSGGSCTFNLNNTDTTNGGTVGTNTTGVPEPATLLLTATGIAGLLVRRRRR